MLYNKIYNNFSWYIFHLFISYRSLSTNNVFPKYNINLPMSLCAFMICCLCIVPCFSNLQLDKRTIPSAPYPEYTLADNLVNSQLVLVSFACLLSVIFPLFCDLLSDHNFVAKTSSSRLLHVYERYAIITPMLFLPAVIIVCRYTAPSMVDRVYICLQEVRNTLIAYGAFSVIITSPSKQWSAFHVYLIFGLYSVSRGKTCLFYIFVFVFSKMY